MAEALPTRWQGSRPDALELIRRHRPVVLSLWFLALVIAVSLVVPFFLPDALKETSTDSFLPPLSRSADGALYHLCGTDVNGMDLFYRLLSGARVSLGIGFCGAVLSLFIGTFYGMVAGYVGGRVDALMMRLVDIIYSVPRLLFLMLIIATLDTHFKSGLDGARLWFQARQWTTLEHVMADALPYSRVLVMVIALGLVEWLTMARIIRGQVLVLREATFITAARSMGQRGMRILRRHLLPNLSTVILTYLTLTIPAVILDESFLSFLGLGIEDPAASWGSLLKDGAQVINPIDSKWWLLAFPAVLMTASLLALNFIGDGLREVFDPRSAE